MYTHFLQSNAWKTFQTALGKTVFEISTPDFAYLAILEPTKLGNYLYLPYGPSLSEKNPKSALGSVLDSLKSLAKAHNCFFLRLEPPFPLSKSSLESLGLQKSTDLNPAETWILDLTQSKEDILRHMSQGTRTRHNTFAKKGLSVEVSHDPEDIKYLVSLQTALAREKGINTFSETYLKTELEQPFASLYLVHYQDPTNNKDKIIAASLFFDDDLSKTRFYMQSAADLAYKKLPGTVALLSTAIFDAKAKGLETFDFWGIAPDNAPENHPWAGFTAFKKSFGGKEKRYAGTYDLPLDPKKYSLYTRLRSLNRRLRKLKK
ncbi:peptidoglycan bridge formation glycyltransferase FemA/FemB family protein [Candidatus Saccharibacteria bacterium]|nr:peptidoglycan bridge formation glycyltransferase FemA/FemB family protein [Candidatus Saccharibacteria bacterium]